MYFWSNYLQNRPQMEFIIKIGQFLLSLSLLIVLHELGHFIPAKLFKTRVEKFYLFFDVEEVLQKLVFLLHPHFQFEPLVQTYLT